MTRRQMAARWVLVAGILVLLIGALHSIQAPSLYERQAAGGSPEAARGSVYFFLVTGAALLLTGVFLIYAARGIRAREPWGRTVAVIAGLFVLVVGVGGLAYARFRNPLLYVLIAASASSLLWVWVSAKDGTSDA